MATSVYLGGGGGGTPASPTTSVQFNNAGAFGGSANFEWLPSLNVQGLSNAFSSIDDTMNFLPTLNVVKAATWPVTTTSIVGSVNGNILNVIDTTDDWTPFGIHAGVDKDHLYEVIKLTYNNDGSGRMSGAFLLNGIGNGGSNGAAIYGDFDSGLAGNFYGFGTYSPATTVEVIGNAAVRSLPTPAAAPSISNVGTPGVTTYTYVVVNKSGSTHSAASDPGSTATGNATLTGTNYNVVTLGEVDAATSYDIYRTAGGATQGLIGTTRELTFNDTGLAGDGSTAPTTDTTGRMGIGINTPIATLDVRGSVNLQGLNSGTPSEIDIVAGSGNTGNTPGAPVVITAGDGNGSGLGGSVLITAGGSGSGTPGDIVLTSTDFIKMTGPTLFPGNGSISIGQTNGNSLILRAYDVDGATYKTFLTLTSANTPDMTIGPAAGATVTLQASTYKSSDGSTGATAGPFTTISSITVKNGLVTALTGS